MNEAEAADQPPRQERPVPAPRPRRTIIDIATFSGQNNEDIGEWLIKWQVAAAANGWTEEQQLQLLPAFLSGRAARMFWRIPLEARNDLEQVKECLDELFNTEEKRFLARQKLQEIIQGPRESVVEFSEKVDRLVLKGHDGLDNAERRDRIACESFVKGLRPEIKETVWEKCPHTFQEAVTAAERREVFLNASGRKTRVNEISDDVMVAIQKFNQERRQNNEEIWKAIQNLTSAVQDLVSRTASAQPLAPVPTPSLTPSLSPSLAPSQSQFQPRQQGKFRQPGRQVVCYHCNQTGHMRRDCPQMKSQRGQQEVAPTSTTSQS